MNHDDNAHIFDIIQSKNNNVTEKEENMSHDEMLGQFMKLANTLINKTNKNTTIEQLISSRIEMGYKKYGHGLRINDNTTQWGTEFDSWDEMALEEALDGLVYISASMLRNKSPKS